MRVLSMIAVTAAGALIRRRPGLKPYLSLLTAAGLVLSAAQAFRRGLRDSRQRLSDDERLDDTLADSFPASDPPAVR